MDSPLPNTTPAVETSSSSKTRPALGSTVPKLRDSCVACASSKVRCHRQKPSCSKCVARGIKCEYVRSKRGGRNPAARSDITTIDCLETTTTMPTVVTLGSPQLPVSPVNWFAPLPAASYPCQTSTTMSVASSSKVSDPLDSSPSTGFPGLESEFEQFIASASDSYFASSKKDLNHIGDLGDLDSFSMAFIENDTFSTSGEADTPAPISSDPQSSVSSASSQLFPPVFTNDILQNNHDSETTSSKCGCKIWAVGLMKQFFTDSPADSPSSSGTTTPTHYIRTIISRNKQAIDKIDAILRCSCSHDGYLLVLLSMILLKVMDCYADAAKTRRSSALSTTSGSENTSGAGSSDNSNYGNTENTGSVRSRTVPTNLPLGHSDKRRSFTYVSETDATKSARSSMHLILGELHRPQRLVNQLSDMIKAEEAKSSAYEPNNAHLLNYSGLGKVGSIGVNPNPISLFSDIFLRQLGLDLRRRLQKLSLEIREALRRE